MKCPTGKVSHYTEDSARCAAKHRAAAVGFELNVYRCEHCKGYHLTRFPAHFCTLKLPPRAAQSAARAT